MVLYGISYRMFKSFWAGAAVIVFFFFRSGTAFWRYLWEHLQAGDLVRTLEENTAFIGYTTNENWGLWNFNVYLNQRHLAFGQMCIRDSTMDEPVNLAWHQVTSTDANSYFADAVQNMTGVNVISRCV